MKKPVSLLAMVLPMTLLVAGCKNPLDGLTDINLNFNERVEIAATFQNGNGLATIGDLRVTWDGELLPGASPAQAVELVAVSRTRYGRQSGSHRLSFQIVSQTSSPNPYQVTGLVITSYDDRGVVNGTVSLEPKSATLETNASIAYDFRL
jgi:hypothetical protein